MPNILTISTLFNKGGAAHIAYEVHEGLRLEDYDCKYLYGYGKNGLANEIKDSSVIKLDYKFKFTPHANFLSSRLTGIDLLNPNKHQIENLTEWADVIICHTLHSFMINYKYFFNVLANLSASKKIFFVAHDSWHYTGRCAFRFDCLDWQSNCITCNHKDYYPPTVFSFSNNESINKIAAIKKIGNLSFITPAKWIKKDLSLIYPGIKNYLIRNGIDTSFFSRDFKKNPDVDSIHFAVSCVDFQQEGKVDLVLIKNLLDLGYEIHFIGKNAPFLEYKNAISHGYVTDRVVYLNILSNVDCYLFSSVIDIYPTVLIDAICSGCYIFYTASAGALEIMESENKWLGSNVVTALDVNTIVASARFKSEIMDESERLMALERALNFFDRKRMVREYIKLISA